MADPDVEDSTSINFGPSDSLGDAGTDQDDVDENLGNNEIGRRERARLKEMERLKRKKIQEILDSQNAAIDADMNKKGKGRLKYLLEKTETFAHFAKGSSSSSQKKPRGREMMDEREM